MIPTKHARKLALLLAVLLAVAACGRDDDDTATDDGGTAATEPAGGEPEPAPGFDGRTIRLGVLTPLSGAVATIGKPLTAGNEVFFRYLNEEKGGIAGKYEVELLIEDTAYDPPTAIQKYNKLKDDVVLFAQILGTPVTNAVLPLLEQDRVVAQPASLDAAWVRKPNLLPVGAPYQTQFVNAADYYLNEAGGKGRKICFIGIEGPYGDAGLDGLEFAGRALGFEIAVVTRYKASDTDFSGQISQLKGGGCEAVFMTALPTQTPAIVGGAAQQQFSPQFVAQSPAWNGALVATPAYAAMERSLWVVAEGVTWGDRSNEGMRDMLDRLEKYKPDQPPDYYFSFGYSAANAVTQVLEQAVDNGDLSRDGILRAMEDVQTLEFDGLSGDYGYGAATERKPPTASTLYKVNRANPIGLEAIKVNFASDAAAGYPY